jgi:hypothetical protein
MVINVNRYGFLYGEIVGIFRGMQCRGFSSEEADE